MTEASEERYQKVLDGGWKADYIIRGLNEDEIASWAQFCASIFAYKVNPPPASYFERHYYNDPNRGQASLIRVACYNGEIVASCRLFLKNISTGGKTIVGGATHLKGGGIGEVCTKETHRKRGLSKVLLQNVMEIMKERQLQVSLLHAAPSFFPVYEKAGNYQCTLSKWSVAPLTKATSAKTTTNDDGSFSIRNAAFPNDTDQLCKLHKAYSEDTFAGCIVRSPEYWNDYLSKELGTSLWVLTSSSISSSDNNIVGWLSLRLRGDRVQLREFGVDSTAIGVAKVLNLLLPHAMKELNGVSDNECLLVIPTEVLDQAKAEYQQNSEQLLLLKNLEWDSVVQDNDQGWMYKILDDQVPFDAISGETTPHLIWPADSF
ncbi:unnamed protein product [Cylindrotheca closterium]|uniref:N-acetyltransferase domain-containing protein n=1 Tax=Cylindrotheca closterium TaxID=2856 RepID=A0AAD2CB91_9STRA|nr:unnamed protein product [Cylindrotheca closterium]